MGRAAGRATRLARGNHPESEGGFGGEPGCPWQPAAASSASPHVGPDAAVAVTRLNSQSPVSQQVTASPPLSRFCLFQPARHRVEAAQGPGRLCGR